MVNKKRLVQNFQKVYGKMMMKHEISPKGTAKAMQEIVMTIGKKYSGQELIAGDEVKELVKAICEKQASKQDITSQDAEAMIAAFDNIIRNQKRIQKELEAAISNEEHNKEASAQTEVAAQDAVKDDESANLDNLLNSIRDQEDPVEEARAKQAKEEKQRDDAVEKSFQDAAAATDSMFTDPIKVEEQEDSSETKKSYPVVETVSQPNDYTDSNRKQDEPDEDDLDKWMAELGIEEITPTETGITEDVPQQKAVAPQVPKKPEQKEVSVSSMPVKKALPTESRKPMPPEIESRDEDETSVEDILTSCKKGILAAQEMMAKGGELVKKGLEMQETGKKNEQYFRDMISNMENIEETMRAAAEFGKELDKNRSDGTKRVWSATMWQDDGDSMKITLKGVRK